MGEGLKRVAKLCGGLTVKDKTKTVKYNAKGVRQGHDCHPGHDSRNCPCSMKITAETSRTMNGYACWYTGGHCIPNDHCKERVKEYEKQQG